MEKLRKPIVIAVVALLVLFCAIYAAIEVFIHQQTPVRIARGSSFRIDASFSPTRLAAIRSAIGKWEAASDGCLKIPFRVSEVSISDIIHWIEDGTPTIYNASSILSWKRYLASQLCASACLGVTQCITEDIFLIEDGDKLFETVALHEIGHVLLGGWHSTNSNHLMYPTVSNPKGISPYEAKTLRLLYCSDASKAIQRLMEPESEDGK